MKVPKYLYILYVRMTYGNRWARSWTVCGELRRRKMLSYLELQKDKMFIRRKIPLYAFILYKVFIIPVVFFMKLSGNFTCLVHSISRRIWFNKILTEVSYYDIIKFKCGQIKVKIIGED